MNTYPRHRRLVPADQETRATCEHPGKCITMCRRCDQAVYPRYAKHRADKEPTR